MRNSRSGITRRQCLQLLAATTPLLPSSIPFANAQDVLPKKPINMVIGFSAGGAIDTLGRIVAQSLTTRLGQPVVIQTRTGAGGNIAQQLVFQSEADGSNVLLAPIGSLVINPQLMKMTHNPKELSPVSLAAAFPNVLVVKADSGVNTLRDFIALAKKDSTKVSFASSGSGSASHLAGEMLNQRAGLDILHVPFQGGAPAVTAVLGGQVTGYYAAPSSALPHTKSGKLLAIATTGLERDPEFPNVPTIAESGFPGFNATNWYAFLLPPKTPSAIVKRWNSELVAVMSQPAVMAACAQHGMVPKPSTPEQLAGFMDSESAAWGKVITERKINLK